MTDVEQSQPKWTIHGQDFAAYPTPLTSENRSARGAFAEEAGPATRD